MCRKTVKILIICTAVTLYTYGILYIGSCGLNYESARIRAYFAEAAKSPQGTSKINLRQVCHYLEEIGDNLYKLEGGLEGNKEAQYALNRMEWAIKHLEEEIKKGIKS